MLDTNLYMDRITGEIFESKRLLVEQIQSELNTILNEGKYDDLRINTILQEIADEIEKKTGKRPVFGSWARGS